MSIKTSLSSDGLEVYTPPTLKQICLYKCFTNKNILTKELEADEATNGSEKLEWKKFSLKEPIQRELVEALLDAADEYLFMLTPKYEAVLAAIRMSQPEHLVKVHVSNTYTLKDHHLEFLLSGGNVKSLDIHGCESLRNGSLNAINKFGSKLEYLRIGDSRGVFPDRLPYSENATILRTPNLKTFVVSKICHGFASNFLRSLLRDFISNLEDLKISEIDRFRSLEFLEPAKNKLSTLSLRNCVVRKKAKAWASLLKLNKLRFLDLVGNRPIGSSIGDAFIGENVVQRLLTSMPNLTHLAVDPGLVKDVVVATPIRGQAQGSVAKRLEFLGIMGNDEDELRKAKLLANDVAHFGTFEGEFRILEYFSNLLNSTEEDLILERLLESLNLFTPPWKTVAAISSLMKTFKNNGVAVASPELFLKSLKQLLTTDVVSKLGTVLKDQCIEAISAFMSRWSRDDNHIDETISISGPIDIIMILDVGFCFDHYVTLVPMVMGMAEMAMTDCMLRCRGADGFKNLLKNLAKLLEKVLDRFPGEINELWGISSFLVVIECFMRKMVVEKRDRNDLVEILSSMIESLRKLCANSGRRRAAFHCAKGIRIVMDLLKETIDGRLGLAERDVFTLLDILKIILQDAKLKLVKSGMIASGLEELLLSLHTKCVFWKPPNSDTRHYIQLQSIASFLEFLESDPRHDYNASAAVKEIMIMKLK